MVLRIDGMYRGVKIKVINPTVYPRLRNEDEIPKKVKSALAYNKHEMYDYQKIREKYMLYDGEKRVIRDQMVKDLYNDVRYLMLNNIEIHIAVQDNNDVLLILVEYGALYHDKNHALGFKSILDIYDDLKEYDISQTSDGRVSFITNNNRQALSLDQKDIKKIFTEIFDHRLNVSGLQSSGSKGGLIAMLADEEYHAGNENIVLISPPSRVRPYLQSFVNNAIEPYKRVLMVGGKQPTGFTKINMENTGYDLVELMKRADAETWIPVMRLIEHVYSLFKFSTHFQELWTLFRESVSEEQKDLVDFQFLVNRINDLEVNMIASIEDYKKQLIQVGFTMFDNRIMKRGGKMLPNLLWMPITSNKETVIIMAYLMAYNKFLGMEYDLIMINDSRFSGYIRQDMIDDQLRLISDSCRVYSSMQAEIWDNTTTVFIQPNPQNLFLLSKYKRDVSVLAGNHLLLSTGELIVGIRYSNEFANWNIKELGNNLIEDYLDNTIETRDEEEVDQEIPENKEEEEEVQDNDIIEEFYAEMGVKDYVYRANQGTPTFDHRDRLDLILGMADGYEILFLIRDSMGRQMNQSQLESRLQTTAQELSDNGLISKILISGDDHMLGLLDNGDKFIKRSIDRIIKIDEAIATQFLGNMSTIHDHAESRGTQTYLRTLVALAQLIEYYYHRKKNRQDHMLTAISHTWDDSILDNPDNFSKIFFARYYSRLQELLAEADTVEVKEEIDLSRIPSSGADLHDITEDPLETMDRIVVRKNKSHPYISKKEKDKEPVRAEETEWVKEFDTPTADGVSIPQTDGEKSVLVGDYVILGDGQQINLDSVLGFGTDNLKINTRSKNLLRENGVGTIKQLRDYNRPFASIKGIGEKLNDKLTMLRKELKAMTEADELVSHLSDDGRKEYVLIGGTIDNMDHSYLRRVGTEELSELTEIIDTDDTPKGLVGSVTRWILERLGRNPGDGLDDMLSDLGLMQERSNPLLMVEGELVKLGFPYVYKKQDEFEESMEYSKVIAELRVYIREQVHSLVFPVKTIQSAESLIDKLDTLDINADEKMSFTTAGDACRSNDYKSAFTLYYSTLEGYLRRVSEEQGIAPGDKNMADLSRGLNKKYKLGLAVKPFEGKLREMRNAIVHGNTVDERSIESGLYELIKYIIQGIERTSNNNIS